MLEKLRKTYRVLSGEGPAGLVNRLRYRRDERLLHDQPTDLKPPFRLVGQGRLFSFLQQEMGRRGLLEQRTPSDDFKSIVFNPAIGSILSTMIAAIVLEDEYLSSLPSSEKQHLITGIGDHPVIVTSVHGVDQLLALGVRRQNISVIPLRETIAAQRLAISRWLVYVSLMEPEQYALDYLATAPRIKNRGRVCISLPEHPSRRAFFEKNGPDGFEVFDGVRLLPAWQGCAWSYKTLAMKALDSGAKRLTICEDDVLLGDDFDSTFDALNRCLDRSRWDVFNGLMTRAGGGLSVTVHKRLGDRQILRSESMMGMVFNIYNRTALEWIADWSPDSGSVETNTIDEWLNLLPGIAVLTAVPFMAGHRDNAHSTIFGFKNARYGTIIRSSERALLSRVANNR